MKLLLLLSTLTLAGVGVAVPAPAPAELSDRSPTPTTATPSSCQTVTYTSPASKEFPAAAIGYYQFFSSHGVRSNPKNSTGDYTESNDGPAVAVFYSGKLTECEAAYQCVKSSYDRLAGKDGDPYGSFDLHWVKSYKNWTCVQYGFYSDERDFYVRDRDVGAVYGYNFKYYNGRPNTYEYYDTLDNAPPHPVSG